MISEKINYICYSLDNIPGNDFKFLEDCEGAIGFCVEDKIKGYRHKIAETCTQLSLAKNNVEFMHTLQGRAINLTKVVHAFIAKGLNGPLSINVFEANAQGFMSNEINIGDNNWDSVFLFLPKDNKVSSSMSQCVAYELMPNSIGKLGSYSFFGGFKDSLTKKEYCFKDLFKKNAAREMAYFLQKESIKDVTGRPKSAICGELATRVLRASTLISKIKPEKISIFEKMSFLDLKKLLYKKLSKEGSKLSNAFHSSKLFSLDSNTNTLPYELFLVLSSESEAS